MELVRLHIDNFGKLSNFDYEFNKGINTIFEENGWGKTTLTVFLKAMLFGYDGRKKSVADNDRLKYAPWNGGVYGGSLVINTEEESILIERVFHPSKSNSDEFKVFDLSTNKQIDKYSSNIGEELLGLNADSFERSIFIPQKDIELGFNEDLRSKLANLVGGTNDVQSYDNALKAITNKYKIIKKNSKSGLLIDTKAKLFDLEQKLALEEEKISSIPQINAQIDSISAEIESIESKSSELNEKIEHNAILEEKKQNKKMLELLEAQLNQEESKKQAILAIFNGSIPEANQLIEYKQKINDYESSIIKYDSISEMSTNNELVDIPTADEIIEIEKLVEEYDNNKYAKAKIPSHVIIELILSILLFVSGVGVMFANMIIGLIILMIGVFGLFVFLFLYLNNSLNKKKSNNPLLEEKIREFFARFKIYSSDFNKNLYQIKANAQKNYEIENKKQLIKNNTDELSCKINKLKIEIDNFLNRYCLTSKTYLDRIIELEKALSSYNDIERSISYKKKEIDNHIRKYDLNSIDESYSFDFNETQDQLSVLKEQLILKSNEKSRLISLVTMYEESKNLCDEYNNEIDILKEEIQNMMIEYDLLVKTENMLTNSQEMLLAKYVAPMNDKMEKYLKLFLSSDKEFALDTDFNFYYIEDGKRRKIDYYSKGYQQLLYICLRFSLVECLYSSEKPFIILDDPFVNMDEVKISNAISTLKELGKEIQVLYFTCHKSRVIE